VVKDYTWLIDLNWVANLFYYATGDLSQGVQFTLNRIQGEFKPKRIICAMDSHPSFRHEMYPEYKAGRPPKGDDFYVQFQEALESISVPVIGIPQYEADDILASLATKYSAGGDICVIVSGDKDLRQCLIKNKIGMYTKKHNTAWHFYSVDDAEKSWGIDYSLFTEYQALVGDSADNIKGCEGIGPKSAVKLIKQYGSIDEIMKHKEELSPALQNKLNNFDIDFNRKLVTLVKDIDVKC
jgi:DNA polymerase-1